MRYLVERSVTVELETGLQARPAAQFVQEANRFSADLFLDKDGKRLNEEVSGMKQEITGINEEVTGIKQEITGLNEEVTGIKQEITGLNEEVTGIKQEITGIKQELTEVKQEQQDMKSQMNHRFDTLEVQVGHVQKEVTDLKSSVNRMEQATHDDIEAILHTMKENQDEFSSKIAKVTISQERQEKTLETLALRSIEQEAKLREKKGFEF